MNKTLLQGNLVGESKLYTINQRSFLVLDQSSAVYEVSERFLNGPDLEINRQIEVLSKMRYLCRCKKVQPQINIESITLNIAHACNLVCDYCSVYQGTYNTSNPNQYMTIDTAKKAVDYLTNLSSRNVLTIEFFGGEPLLNFSLIKELTRYCLDKYPDRRFRFGINTNGTLINNEMAKLFSDRDFLIVVSLDGHQDMHDAHRKSHNGSGSWDLVTQGINLLKQYKVKYRIRSTTTPDSDYNLQQTYNRLKSAYPTAEGIDVRYESLYRYTGGADNIQNKFLLDNTFIFDKNSESGYRIHSLLSAILTSPSETVLFCEYGLKKLAVDPEGDLYLCPHSIPIKHLKRELYYNKIGNLDAGLDLQNTLPSKCRQCWALNLCGKGCHIRRMMNDEPDQNLCDFTFGVIEKCLTYIAENDLDTIYEKEVPSLLQYAANLHTLVKKTCPDIKPLFLLPCGNCSPSK
ncbi:MAG: radical SAM protein [Planctomycetes bacterium]|nr:radical SAM protein [Planctomycetota bacterium]